MGCLQEICDIGYSPHDIITTFFRVVKLSPELPEFLKLEFIRVRQLLRITCNLLPANASLHWQAIIPHIHCLPWLLSLMEKPSPYAGVYGRMIRWMPFNPGYSASRLVAA